MIKYTHIFTLVVLIWVSKLSFGQTELMVITLDSDQEPLPAVLVTIKSPASEKTIGVSDSTGTTKFELVDTGTFTMSAQFVGDIEKRELHLDTGSHAITIHFKRKELNTVLVEAPSTTLEDWQRGCGTSRYHNFKMGIVGGIWMPDGRPPTAGSILNQQPYD